MFNFKNKLLSFTFLLLGFSSFASLAQPSNQEERKELTLAEKQELKAKEIQLKQFISENPRVPEAHLNLGNIYWEEGRDGKPIRHYLAAIKLNPNYAEAYYNLGNVFFVQGEHEQAVQAYNKAIEIKPSFAPAHNGLGNALVDEKQYLKAIESYQKAIQVDPNYKEANYNLCASYLYAAKYYEAINSCLNYLKIAEDARAYNNLGNSYFRTKQFDLALKAYKKSLEINPQLPEAHFNIAAINLVHTKNMQEAVSHQKMLEVIDPQKGRKLSALIKNAK